MSRLPMAERRVQLVQAAIVVAIRDGIDAATVRAVAAEAGVSLGVVHYCFDDKNELLREVGRTITAQNIARVDFASAELADARAAVGLIFDGVWDAMRESRGAQLLRLELSASSLRHPELRVVASGQLEHRLIAAEGLLVQAAAAAGVTWSMPVSALARLCVAVLDGLALAWLIDGDDAAAWAASSSFADYVATYAVPAAGGPR